MNLQISINESVLDLSAGAPRLLGARCGRCSHHTFPAQSDCVKCSGTAMETVALGTEGELWAWTVQGFPPKVPPYLGETSREKFKPYGVGYVSLPELKVEARLTEARPSKLEIGMPMKLTLIPLSKDEQGREIVTFGFAPVVDR